MKSSLVSTIAFASGVAAFWRMPCRSQTGFARIDPLVSPEGISDHVHTITGGGNFGNTTSFEALTAEGSCTACAVTQDHSAYWTPALYFLYENGTSVMVPQMGGMLAYYLYYLDNVKAFPEGFAMIAGNPANRNFSGPFPDAPLSSWPTDPKDQFFLQQRALGFNCLNYGKLPPEPSLYRHQFPSKEYMDANCPDGLRLELAFPSCGKEGVLDSADHKSHVAYPSLVKEGNCPEGFDVHYPFLFFETIFATNKFAGERGTFILSTGDPVGTSYHGDFVMGWESTDFLQKALDTCQNPSGQIEDCPLFDIQDDSEAAKCTFDMPAHLKNDNCHGPRDGLPVDVPIQWGPEPATKYSVAGAGQVPTSVSQSTPSSFALPTVSYTSASSTAEDAAATSAPATTAAPVAPAGYGSSSENSNGLTTTTITKDGQIVELVIAVTEVTVTVVPTEAPTEAPTAGSYGKRHVEQHKHHAHGHH